MTQISYLNVYCSCKYIDLQQIPIQENSCKFKIALKRAAHTSAFKYALHSQRY